MISLNSPVRTWAHDWPAGLKLSALSVSTCVLFFIESLSVQVAVLTGVLVIYALPGRLFFVSGISKLRMLWPFLLLLGLWHLFIGDYAAGGVIAIRLISAVALANLVTMTTRLTDMIEVVRKLTAPLRTLGLNLRAFEIAIALVIRMTPVMFAKGVALQEAWRARSPKRVGWRIVLPFILLTLDDADHVADALKARGGLNSTEEY